MSYTLQPTKINSKRPMVIVYALLAITMGLDEINLFYTVLKAFPCSDE